MTKRNIYLFIKLLLSTGLIVFLFSKIDVIFFISKIRSINLLWLLFMFILPHLAILASSIKWQWLLKELDIAESYALLFMLYLIGTFFSNFLPTMAGGDVVRVYQLSYKTEKLSSVAAATFMERFLGLSALFTFVFITLLISNLYGTYTTGFNTLIVAVLVIYSLIFYIVFKEGASDWFSALVNYRLLKGIISLLTECRSKILLYKSRLRVIFASYLISLVFYFLAVCTVYAAAKSLNIDVEFHVVFIVVPLVLLVGLLPVSIGGLGLNEGSYVYLFSLFGMSLPDALSIAILLRARILMTGILGGCVYMYYKKSQGEALPDNV